MIMTVYGRFFKLYLYTAIAPVPLSAFAGEPSQNIGKSFIKSYAAVCLEGAILTGGIKLEVKINREIRNYTESMFFGLSMRQFVFSVLAILVAVVLYFLLKPHFGTETVSWMCILGAAPFAALGFITYHGMTAEQFLWAWLR